MAAVQQWPRALFGLRRDVVETRLAEMGRALAEMREALADRGQECEALASERDALQAELRRRQEEIARLDAQQAAVARVLVTAEEEAQAIRAAALADADDMRRRWSDEVAEAEQELLTVRGRIDALRGDFLALLNEAGEALSGRPADRPRPPAVDVVGHASRRV